MTGGKKERTRLFKYMSPWGSFSHLNLNGYSSQFNTTEETISDQMKITKHSNTRHTCYFIINTNSTGRGRKEEGFETRSLCVYQASLQTCDLPAPDSQIPEL